MRCRNRRGTGRYTGMCHLQISPGQEHYTIKPKEGAPALLFYWYSPRADAGGMISPLHSFTTISTPANGRKRTLVRFSTGCGKIIGKDRKGCSLDTLETTQTGVPKRNRWIRMAPAMQRAFRPGGLHPASVLSFPYKARLLAPALFSFGFSACVSRPGVPSPCSVFPFVFPPGSGRLCRRVAAIFARRSR